MQRRQLLKLATSGLGGAALGPAVTALSACDETTAKSPAPAERAPTWKNDFFTREQALGVEDLAELLIPEGTTPGARSAGVGAFVESVVRDVYGESEQKAFLAGLDAMAARCRAAHGKELSGSSAAEQQALLAALVREAEAAPGGEQAVFLRALRDLSVRGFCTSKLGATRLLAYEPTPGPYQGCMPLALAGKASATW